MKTPVSGRARPPAEPLAAARPLDGDTASNPSLRPERKPLGHETPEWVSSGAIFFVTVCARVRANRPLLQENLAAELVTTVAFLHRSGAWFARLFMVMPDHVHGLFAFPPSTALATRVSAWKSYTHKRLCIEWQERFFEHRLRSDESLDEKAHYIRMNPVRAGLVSRPEQWPYVFDAYSPSGSAGRLALPQT